MIRQPPRSTRTDTLLSLHDALPIFGAVQLDAGTSQKAGTGALIQAFRSADSGRTLVAASEKRRARPASEDELANGDAAAALLVGPGEGLARFIGSHSVSADFVDHFRTTAAEFDYGWEARWIREEGYAKLAGEEVSGLLAAQGLSGLAIAHFAAAIPAKGAAGALECGRTTGRGEGGQDV